MSNCPDEMITDSRRLPVACSLTAADGSRRLARWAALAEAATPSIRRQADRLTVRFRRTPKTAEELRQLVAAERECCAFAEWRLTLQPSWIELEIVAEPEGLRALAPLVVGQAA